MRLGWDALIRSKSRVVSRKCPRWLTPNWYSKPSRVDPFGHAITPALFTRMSHLLSSLRNWSQKPRTDPRLARSSCITDMLLFLVALIILLAASCPAWTLRQARITRAPATQQSYRYINLLVEHYSTFRGAITPKQSHVLGLNVMIMFRQGARTLSNWVSSMQENLDFMTTNNCLP